MATWDSENEPNPYEYNARLLSVNSQTDNHINFSGDIDWFRFGATAGNEYSVSIVQENGVGVELYVYNPDITLLSSSNGTNSYNFTCSVGGIHYIKVVRDGGTATGRYVLAIQSASEPIIAPLPPSQCEMTGSFTSTQLSWAPVNMDVNGNPVSVSYYVIEASDEPNSGFTSIGTTTNTQFGIDSTTHAKRFYRIVAVVQ